MSVIRELSDDLYAAKKEIGRMPDVLFVDEPVAQRLRVEINQAGRARGSSPISRPLKVLDVPVKAFEFIEEDTIEVDPDIEPNIADLIHKTMERMMNHARRQGK